MAERRKTKRRQLFYFGRVYDENAQKLFGYVVDLNEDGFMLLSEEPFPVGESRRLKLEITEDISENPYIIFTAKSVWCGPDIGPGHFNIGFEIEDIQPSDKALIASIVEKYGFRDN